mgnify:FL=1
MFFKIQDTLVQLDIIEKCFCCDLSVCKGCCCIEGDAGAPITEEEGEAITRELPKLMPLMEKRARKIVEEEGISYLDQTGELVTQIIDSRDCVFARTDDMGICYCTIQAAQAKGIVSCHKPLSCSLYPIRVTQHPAYTAVEYHHWDICHAARINGKKTGTPIYIFLKQPLINRFGQEWYNELCLVAQEWKKQK